jgi:hypothetical protein
LKLKARSEEFKTLATMVFLNHPVKWMPALQLHRRFVLDADFGFPEVEVLGS